MQPLDDQDRHLQDKRSPTHRRAPLWRCWITGGLTVVALTVTSLGSHHSGSLARLAGSRRPKRLPGSPHMRRPTA